MSLLRKARRWIGGKVQDLIDRLPWRRDKEYEPGEPELPPPSGPVSQQFLWKPISESDGRLVILLPGKYRGKAESCKVYNAAGLELEAGNFVGDTHNGYRPHFRFRHRGEFYGKSLTVKATLTGGNEATWHIPNGAMRYSQTQ